MLCFPISPVFLFFLVTISLQYNIISFPVHLASVRKSPQISHCLKVFSTSLSASTFPNLYNSPNISSVDSSNSFLNSRKWHGRLSSLEKRSDALKYFLQDEKEKSISPANSCSHIGREWAVSAYGLLLIIKTQIYCFTYQFYWVDFLRKCTILLPRFVDITFWFTKISLPLPYKSNLHTSYEINVSIGTMFCRFVIWMFSLTKYVYIYIYIWFFKNLNMQIFSGFIIIDSHKLL